ncbi:MAG TPA: hypothetical protein VFF63_08160 [Candidatus Babeliales bacterium]|nr:hypothetical protein [Candidatus Babeliales bacterium]
MPLVTGRVGPGHATKAYGVGLADGVGTVPSWGYEWCNGAPGTLSLCPDEVPGKRSFKNSASGGQNLGSEGYVKAKINVTQKLGATSYLLDGEVDVLSSQTIAEAGASISNGWWQDKFTISSQTLKPGTPVTLGVQAALNPTETDVACDAAQTSFGELFIYSASITPSSGSEFAISGNCVNGTFVYQLYGTSMQGTTATGTINTAVGDSFSVIFTMTGEVAVCEDNKNQACLGLYGANLGGSYAFTVTSITSGATYTTASGNTY